jgi:hypothetical protein
VDVGGVGCTGAGRDLYYGRRVDIHHIHACVDTSTSNASGRSLVGGAALCIMNCVFAFMLSSGLGSIRVFLVILDTHMFVQCGNILATPGVDGTDAMNYEESNNSSVLLETQP